MTKTRVWAGAVALAVVCVLAAPAAAQQTTQQTAQPTEAELLKQIQADPSAVAAYLDLAKLYVEQGRLEEAYQLMARSLAVISEARTAEAAPEPEPRPAGPDEPVRIGGDITAPTKLRDVRPLYPKEAQDANVQGLVIVEAIIDRDGGVRDAKILRSVPMLDDAALDAVLQWKYTPTVLNGEPVEVIMTITVNFTLND